MLDYIFNETAFVFDETKNEVRVYSYMLSQGQATVYRLTAKFKNIKHK